MTRRDTPRRSGLLAASGAAVLGRARKGRAAGALPSSCRRDRPIPIRPRRRDGDPVASPDRWRTRRRAQTNTGNRGASAGVLLPSTLGVAYRMSSPAASCPAKSALILIEVPARYARASKDR